MPEAPIPARTLSWPCSQVSKSTPHRAGRQRFRRSAARRFLTPKREIPAATHPRACVCGRPIGRFSPNVIVRVDVHEFKSSPAGKSPRSYGRRPPKLDSFRQLAIRSATPTSSTSASSAAGIRPAACRFWAAAIPAISDLGREFHAIAALRKISSRRFQLAPSAGATFPIRWAPVRRRASAPAY